MLVALGACAATPAAPPCERSIDGVWRSDVRTPDGERMGWHFLERRGAPTIDGYPMYRDVPGELPAGVQAAPSSIELVRDARGALTGGRVLRRYELAGQRCVVAAPVHVAACAGDTLTLELGALPAPTDWAACATPADAATLAPAPITGVPVTLTLRR